MNLSEEFFQQREKELREKYPDMFSHPEAESDEIFFRNTLYEFAMFDIPGYHQRGIPSARLGKTFNGKWGDIQNMPIYPVFMKLRELVVAEQKQVFQENNNGI